MATVQTISAAIRGRRHQLGLSQAALAMRAGVSRKFVSEVERGKGTVELGRVLMLLDGLDLTLRPESTGQEEPASGVLPGSFIDLDRLMGDYQAGERITRIPEDEVRARAADTLHAVPHAMAAVADSAEVRALSSELPARLADLVAARADRCRCVLDRA